MAQYALGKRWDSAKQTDAMPSWLRSRMKLSQPIFAACASIMALPFGGTIPGDIAPRIAAIPGVAAVSGELLSLVGTDKDEYLLTACWAQGSFFWKSSGSVLMVLNTLLMAVLECTRDWDPCCYRVVDQAHHWRDCDRGVHSVCHRQRDRRGCWRARLTFS